MIQDGFPEHSARGITRSECIDGKDIRRCVFAFDKIRELGRKEVSIQWLDDEDSETQMKSRLKDRRPQFVLGFAVLRTTDLERLKHSSDYSGMDYIRAPSEGNEYHGLITIPYGMSDRQLAAELAMLSEKYEFDQNLPVG